MHTLVARMGHQNAVVISQKLLAKLVGCNERTIRRAIEDLERDRWIQVVQLGTAGTMNAYVVNDTVAWGQRRDQKLTLSVFSAAVVADVDDQSEFTLEARALRRLPVIYPPEQALPSGPGEPGAQMLLDGMEPVIEGAPRQLDIEDYE
jgi:DNA-binding transcriptional regulator YhcF (GntR family)